MVSTRANFNHILISNEHFVAISFMNGADKYTRIFCLRLMDPTQNILVIFCCCSAFIWQALNALVYILCNLKHFVLLSSTNDSFWKTSGHYEMMHFNFYAIAAPTATHRKWKWAKKIIFSAVDSTPVFWIECLAANCADCSLYPPSYSSSFPSSNRERSRPLRCIYFYGKCQNSKN